MGKDGKKSDSKYKRAGGYILDFPGSGYYGFSSAIIEMINAVMAIQLLIR